MTESQANEPQADPKGLAAARRVAGYQIADPSWADMIIGAYLNPEHAQRYLDLEVDEMS